MKIAMVFPSRESEKAISSYTTYLTEAIKELKADIVPINYTAGSYKSFLKIIPQLKDFDIVHIQHEYNLLGKYGIPFFFAYRKLRKLKNVKIVTTMHTALSQKEKFSGSFIKTILRKILYLTQNRLINKKSDAIIVHSNFFIPILVNEYGFDRGKIFTLPHGIIKNVPITSRDKAKSELGLKGNVYLIIGNLHKDHGVDVILKQADKIGKTILVVSSPKPVNDRKQKRLSDYMETLFEIVKENNFSKYVRFDIKPINDKMPLWWKYFSAADFVLQPYKGGIGSGIFTHAMATRTPVIGSNIPFFKEIVKNYNCVKIAEDETEYSNVIKEALKPKNYKKMLEGCEKYFKEENWTNVAKKYLKIYSSLK